MFEFWTLKTSLWEYLMGIFHYFLAFFRLLFRINLILFIPVNKGIFFFFFTNPWKWVKGVDFSISMPDSQETRSNWTKLKQQRTRCPDLLPRTGQAPTHQILHPCIDLSCMTTQHLMFGSVISVFAGLQRLDFWSLFFLCPFLWFVSIDDSASFFILPLQMQMSAQETPVRTLTLAKIWLADITATVFGDGPDRTVTSVSIPSLKSPKLLHLCPSAGVPLLLATLKRLHSLPGHTNVL